MKIRNLQFCYNFVMVFPRLSCFYRIKICENKNEGKFALPEALEKPVASNSVCDCELFVFWTIAQLLFSGGVFPQRSCFFLPSFHLLLSFSSLQLLFFITLIFFSYYVSPFILFASHRSANNFYLLKGKGDEEW